MYIKVNSAPNNFPSTDDDDDDLAQEPVPDQDRSFWLIYNDKSAVLGIYFIKRNNLKNRLE